MKKINFITAVLLLCTLPVLNGCTVSGQNDEVQSTGEAAAASEARDTAAQGDTASQTPETQGKGAALIAPEQLISRQDAETLLGVAVEMEKSENPAVGQKLCLYSGAKEGAGVFLQVCITQQAFMPEGGADTPESIYNATKGAFGGESAVVEGPGDETIRVPGGYYILCEGYMIQISAGNTEDKATIAMLDAASEIAVENLKELIR
jgi:hypothetical protein